MKRIREGGRGKGEDSMTRNCQLSRICTRVNPTLSLATATVAKTVESLHQNQITHPAAVQCRDFYAFGFFWIWAVMWSCGGNWVDGEDPLEEIKKRKSRKWMGGRQR